MKKVNNFFELKYYIWTYFVYKVLVNNSESWVFFFAEGMELSLGHFFITGSGNWLKSSCISSTLCSFLHVECTTSIFIAFSPKTVGDLIAVSSSFLEHCLSKFNRFSFGTFFRADINSGDGGNDKWEFHLWFCFFVFNL